MRALVGIGVGVLVGVAWLGSARGSEFEGAGAYVIVDGAGSGKVVESDAAMQVVDAGLADAGHVGIGPDCACAHYHGTLRGLPDPAPEGCGWGCVELLTSAMAPPFAPLGDAINGLGDPGTKSNAQKLGKGITDAFKNDCGSGVAGQVDALLKELVAAVLAGKLTAANLQDLVSIATNLVAIRDALDGIVAAVLKGKPPKKKPKPCSVRLFVRLGSGKNTVLGDPGKRFIIHPGDLLRLTAEGMPAGGQYMWMLPTPAPGGTSSAGDSAGFMTFKEGKYPVSVTYKCPNPPGGQATATFSAVVDGAYLR